MLDTGGDGGGASYLLSGSALIDLASNSPQRIASSSPRRVNPLEISSALNNVSDSESSVNSNSNKEEVVDKDEEIEEA